jgi:hypothetical protein
VYIFTFDEINGSWGQPAYIKADNASAGAQFGYSVSLNNNGDILAAGANYEGDSGAAYVFTFDNSESAWGQTEYIKDNNGAPGDEFGSAASLSGDGNTLAVSAVRESATAKWSGAVYIFNLGDGVWDGLDPTYLKAGNAEIYDLFGYSLDLSLDGGTLAVGAIFEDGSDNLVSNSGVVYIFNRSSEGVWSQVDDIKAGNTEDHDHFGYSVSLSDDGNTLAVSAPGEDGNFSGLSAEGSAESSKDNNMASNAGAVYIFNYADGEWTQKTYVKSSNTQSNDEFGNAIRLSGDGDTLAVGAPKEDSADNSAPSAGAVYLY